MLIAAFDTAKPRFAIVTIDTFGRSAARKAATANRRPAFQGICDLFLAEFAFWKSAAK
jgi:hypothetical protein